MFSFFRKASPAVPSPAALRTAATEAVNAVWEQICRFELQAAEWHRPLTQLHDVNGLASGYALSIANVITGRKSEENQQYLQLLINEIEIQFKIRHNDIHVGKHLEYQSYAFMLGDVCGGQEATNKIDNQAIWRSNGSKYNLLFEILSIVAMDNIISASGLCMEKIYARGGRCDTMLLEMAVRHLRAE